MHFLMLHIYTKTFSSIHFLSIISWWLMDNDQYIYIKNYIISFQDLWQNFDAQNLRYCCFHKRRICLTFHQHKMVLEPLISINQVLQIGYYAHNMVKKSWWITISVVMYICVFFALLTCIKSPENVFLFIWG